MNFTEALDVAQQWLLNRKILGYSTSLSGIRRLQRRCGKALSAHRHVQQLLSQAQAHEEVEDYEGLAATDPSSTLLDLKLAGTDWDASPEATSTGTT